MAGRRNAELVSAKFFSLVLFSLLEHVLLASWDYDSVMRRSVAQIYLVGRSRVREGFCVGLGYYSMSNDFNLRRYLPTYVCTIR